jgi:hypothetical protein
MAAVAKMGVPIQPAHEIRKIICVATINEYMQQVQTYLPLPREVHSV